MADATTPRTKRCAFLSLEGSESWPIHDDLLVAPMAAAGWEVTPRVPWRSYTTVDWSQYSVAVVRSTWDYQDDTAEFLRAMEHIRAAGCVVENSIETMAWNLNKRYVLDVAARGCSIVPTDVVQGASDDALLPVAVRFAAALGVYDEVVVKPAVGASSFDTFRVTGAQLAAPFTFREDPKNIELRPQGTVFSWTDEPLPPVECDDATGDKVRVFPTMLRFFEHLFGRRPFLLQPFLPTIQTTGEVSLFYFGQRLSHAIRKMPVGGDFRVQEEYGGTTSELVDVPPHVAATASAAVGLAPQLPLYTRVDVVFVPHAQMAAAQAAGWGATGITGAATDLSARVVDGTVAALIELELIEPSLYFNVVEGSTAAFVAEFVRRYGSG